MATKKKSNIVDVGVGFAADVYTATFIAERNYQLAVQRDPSIAKQEVKFTTWPCNGDKFQGWGAKYYYIGVNKTTVLSNHPQLKAAV